MAIKTTLEQLEEVQAAISSVMLGQETWIMGDKVTRANLADLEKREATLISRYQVETGEVTFRTHAVDGNS